MSTVESRLQKATAMAAWRRKNPDKAARNLWRSKMKQKYGLSENDYYELLDAQGGGCAICGNTDERRKLSVDHSHVTGRVRGLLCLRCNSAVAHLGDTAEALRKVVSYLDEPGYL